MKPRHIEVLVVGAGPVGMLAALQLARDGVNVRIIDQADGTCGQSYACALHGRTIQLLGQMELDSAVLDTGHPVERVAFYEGTERRAELSFAQVTPELPLPLIASQADLEATLEESLREAGVRIMWNHRIADVRATAHGAVATLEQLEGTAVGYASPHWETGVKSRWECETGFVLGCDGRHSAVRRLAGIPLESLRHPELFLLYEFDSDFRLADEVRVVLNRTDSNVLWPLAEGRFRWGFQWTDGEPDGQYPSKERTHFWGEDRLIAEQTHEHLTRLIRERAPWFTGTIDDMDWATDVQFEPCMVRQFGIGRCWLAGDAAHQTGPIGVQSMNIGMREAVMLARQVNQCLQEGSLTPLSAYEQEFLPEWQRLVGSASELELADPAIPPVLRHKGNLLESLPASGAELEAMLAALGFRLHAQGVAA